MYPSQNTFGCSDQGVGGWGMWHMGEKRNAYTVLVGNLKKRDNLQDLVIYGSVILKFVMNTYYGRVWTGFSRLRTQKSGQVL